MESIAQFFLAAANWLGIPPDITPWELLNSELITAAIIGFIGLFLNRKVNRLSEKAEDTATFAAYERELEDLAEARETPPDAADAAERVRDVLKRYSRGTKDAPDFDISGLGITEPEAPGAPGAPPPEEEVAETDAAPEAPAEPEPGRNPLQAEASLVVNEAKKFVDARLASQHDGRKQRKYNNIGKRDYRVRVLAARDDGLITGTQALNLLGVFETWRPYGTGRRVVTDDVIAKMKRLLSEAEVEANRMRTTSRRGRKAKD